MKTGDNEWPKKTIPLSKLQIEGVNKISRTTRGYDLTISGKNAEIIKTLSKLDFEDLIVTEPHLEDTFLDLYEN